MNNDFDFTDYIVVYDRKYTSGYTFRKDAFKIDHEHIVPIVYASNHSLCLGHAVLEHRDGGIVAKCKFNDRDEGQFVKTSIVDGKDFAISFFATGIKREGDIIASGSIRAVIVTFKEATFRVVEE